MATSSTKHLTTIQPDWDDLPLACELLTLQYREPNSDLQTLALRRGDVGSRKVQHTIRLLKLLELLDEDGVTDGGRWLAKSYQSPAQQSHVNSQLGIGVKSSLSGTERLLFWLVIYHNHQLPMTAVLQQLSTEYVPVTQNSPAVQSFAERVGHLYPSVESDSSWIPRAKVHYKWLTHLRLAKIRSNRYLLTVAGRGVFEQIKSDCLDEWNTIQPYSGPTLSDYR